MVTPSRVVASGLSAVMLACAPPAEDQERDLAHRSPGQRPPLDLVGKRGTVNGEDRVALHHQAGGGATTGNVGHDNHFVRASHLLLTTASVRLRH